MQIGNWRTTSELNEIYRDARDLGLTENIAELEAFGFTVVPPEKVASPELNDRLRTAVLETHERRTGHRITDLSSDDGVKGGDAGPGQQPYQLHSQMVYEDRAFEEALLDPAVFTIARYLCGASVLLSDLSAGIKGPHDDLVQHLHIDQSNIPPPLPTYAQLANVTWALTDYTAENGPVAIVPGSHRWGRGPMGHEKDFLAESAPVKPIPVEAPAGSLIVWPGTTWHATFPRTAPGLRLNLILVFCRNYMRTIQDFRRISPCPPEIIERNPPEFGRLLGLHHPFPYDGATPPAPDEIAAMTRSGRNQWA